jgi:isopenicillin-N N-acyltransferase like protein
MQTLCAPSNPTLLQIAGLPFEMGYQHGTKLKDKIHQNIQTYIANPSSEGKERMVSFLPHVPTLTSFIPERYLEEMKGIAKGADVPFSHILLLNLFPEMFHCCAITATGQASKDGSLYHARVLDYSAGKDLQSTAVLMIAQPKEGFSFLNVTYAGFIGSVTGMNEKKISLGEIGGLGYGNWNGCPMPLLLRSILEKASSLDIAKKILSSTKRTCEYYYIVGDGNTQESFGCYATPSKIQYIPPGKDYNLIQDSKESDVAVKMGKKSASSTLFCAQPKDALLLTGLSSPERYPILSERVKNHYGAIDPFSLMEIIKQPVAKKHNLHNAIFHPSSLQVWIANAGTKGAEESPACNEPYHCYNLKELLSEDQ